MRVPSVLLVPGLVLGLALPAAHFAPAPTAHFAPAPTAHFARGEEATPFEEALAEARRALAAGAIEKARAHARQALERDPRSPVAWDLTAEVAGLREDKDEQVWALHQEHRLLLAQKAPREAITALRQRLLALDPISPDLLDLHKVFLARLEPLADAAEKAGRPHAAIRLHKEMLVLDPERVASREAIERISSVPDPSLAGEAKPKDLLAGVTEEWIAKHDQKHSEWKDRARLERDNYVTYTDAGYEVLVRASEAMEQMNAFYRVFFQYGTEENPQGVSRIELHLFKNRDEYLKLGASPAEWSGGQFTGDAVETYMGQGGFEEMVGTLFHESAHQFVSLATSASGWLNEGLASFFEGCRVLGNGSVIMNLPAPQRLFPLAARMEQGWMRDHEDGIDPSVPDSQPSKAPTFRTVLEVDYDWGPPWYAPTWGVVYFLYNYQDPLDGRYVYRPAFRVFIDKSGGREGEGAVENFEEVVLANPTPPTPGIAMPAEGGIALPRTVAELDPVWKQWILQLRDEQAGRIQVKRPWLEWARNAVKRKDWDAADELFEKGLLAAPEDSTLLLEFGEHLATQRKNTDRAAMLATQALRVLEAAAEPDREAVRAAERKLEKWDPKYRSLASIHSEIWAATRTLAQRYITAELPLMAMDVSWRLGADFRLPDLAQVYAEAARAAGRSPWVWKLAYDERSLTGWTTTADAPWRAAGREIASTFGAYSAELFDYRFLTLDAVTSGDFSLEAEVRAETGAVNFCGLVFGRKDATTFHAAVLFPRQPGDTTANGFIDLTSFFGSGANQIWRHLPVARAPQDGTAVEQTWHRIRIDIVGRTVDLWFDGGYVASQEFESADVLRGSFGLLTGPGKAGFRNIRYLDRPARDPAMAVDRERRLAEAGASEPGAGGSWLGNVPPWPATSAWAQGERSAWDDRGPGPQLLVLWSIEQNERIPIHDWLTGLAKRYEESGLEVLSICSWLEREKLPAYLAAHPFPGSVAADAKGDTVYGVTYKAYAVERFNLPRLVLLDIDRRVVWEGDPGFKMGTGGRAGDPSYLDDPLAALVGKRKLGPFRAWIAAGKEPGRAARVRAGFAAARPLRREASEYDRAASPEAADAQGRLAAVEGTLDSLEAFRDALAREEAEPAFDVLVEWAAALGRPFDKVALRRAAPTLDSASAQRWRKFALTLPRWRTKLGLASASATGPELLAELAELPGRFPRELAAELRPLIEAGDWDAARKVVDEAPARPALWLARSYFNW